jgi:hypothetical protein
MSLSASARGSWSILAATIAVGVAIPSVVRPPGRPAAGGRRGEVVEGRPAALARHLDRLKALPDNFGEIFEGPGSQAEAAFQQRAYPDSDIPLTRINAARAAGAKLKNKGFPKGKGRPGVWVTIGPSNAIYPFFELRTSSLYVPNEYAAGGRTTALALADDCVPGHCRLYVAPAGGGIWRADNALTGNPHWTYLSTPFEINSVASIAVDPNDPSRNTIWVGTGEPNACGSGCEAGVGLYKSTDGGNTWSGTIGKAAFNGRGVGSIAVKPGDPNTVYAASGRAIRGVSSTCCGGAVSLIPGAPKWGLYKSADGGASWSFIHNGAATTAVCTGDANEANNLTPCSPRGVRRVALDPLNPDIVYAGSYARGVWRSNDGGATWTQIKASLNANITTTRPEIAVTLLPNGKTRMYVAEGHTGARPTPAESPQYSRLFRSDDVATGARPHQLEPCHSRVRILQLLHGTMLVRQLRGRAARPSGHGLPRRLVPVRRDGADLQRPGGRPLDRRGGLLHRHDDGRDRRGAPQRAAPGPARPRRQPQQPVPVLRDLGRGHRPLQR